jgi:hypothetical protein
MDQLLSSVSARDLSILDEEVTLALGRQRHDWA